MKKTLSFLVFLVLSHLLIAQENRPINTRLIQTTSLIDYYAFIQHSNEDSSETFSAALDFSGIRYIKKFHSDGIREWRAYANGDLGKDLSLTKHNCDLDQLDNFVFNFHPSSSIMNRFYTDPAGIKTSLDSEHPSIIKIDKKGALIFSKTLDFVTYTDLLTSVYFDSIGDIYVLGKNRKLIAGKDTFSFYILKLNGQTGQEIFFKNYEGLFPNSATLTFDNNDNIYIFLDAGVEDTSYKFDSITVPTTGTNNIFLKYNKSGVIISGKNFYTNTYSEYSIIAGAKFDGINIVLAGYFLSTNTGNYYGLDGVIFPRKFMNVGNQGLLAKIDLDGNVMWQKPIYSNTKLDNGMWSNIDTDANQNIYGYFFFRNKVNYDNIEYQFDLSDGNKVISKFDTNGNASYLNAVDREIGYPGTFNSMMIDVIDVDKFNIAGITRNDNFLKYSLVTPYIGRSYIATFGNLSKKYLTPENNYLELSTTAIPNNPAPTSNEFSFSLVNNVNWNATSDQSWLNISSLSLTSKSPQQTIIGNGDAKITLFADQNATGISRSSNVIISGENVASKTIIVSQGATLGINSNALSIITLYPNPTSDFLSIKSAQKISKVAIYDMSGKLVKSANLIDEKINVQNLVKGNYLIKLYTENGVVTSKFIKN